MALVVMSSKVVKAMAKLQSRSAISLSPQVGLLNWSTVHHYWGRVVLIGDGEQLLVPGLLLMACPSWRLLRISWKTVPEQAVSCTDEKGEFFPGLVAAAAATHVSRLRPAWAGAEKQWWHHAYISRL